MTQTLRIGAFGACVEVDLPGVSPEQEQVLRASWARCAPEPIVRSIQIEASIEDSASRNLAGIVAPDFTGLEHRLSSAVTLNLIGLARRDYLLLHAAAVADPGSGAVLALIGPSGSGKTTASITLSRTFGYVTDETVAVASDLTVKPYPKPLSIVQPGSKIKKQQSPDELELLSVDGFPPLSLAAVALLDRSAASARPKVEPVALADAIADLVPQISYLSERERPLRQLAQLIGRVGGIQRLKYRDAKDLPEIAARFFAGSVPPGEAEDWQPAAIDSSANSGIRRAKVADAIRSEEQLIVLAGDVVRVLDGIAPAIWEAANGVGLDAIAAAVIEKFGQPAEGSALELTRGAVEELAAAGLLLGAGPMAGADNLPGADHLSGTGRLPGADDGN
ncbi:MAG: hypothetical protein KF772_00750 [Cryobacterium sp.]|nr:hypothetical protein [Cryobacterium sp.]